jgi:hypothetical protein
VYPSLFIQLGGVFGGIVGFGEFYFGPGEAVYWTLGQCPQCLDCLDIFGLEFAAPTSMPAPSPFGLDDINPSLFLSPANSTPR